MQSGGLEIEKIEVGGRPLQATGVHERVMELLTVTYRKVNTTITPRKTVELLKLGESNRLGMKASEVQDAFFGFLGYPRLDTSATLCKAIARGVEEGVFGYYSGTVPTSGLDNRYQVNPDKVIISRSLSEDEVDMESGFLMVPEAIQAVLAETPVGSAPVQPTTPETTGPIQPTFPLPTGPKKIPLVHFAFEASREQLFKIWNAIANLADKAGKVRVEVDARSDEGFDPTWLRNAVQEPLEEADVLKDKKEGNQENG